MVDARQDMEGWGVYSIFKEAGRLLYQHTRILRPFILAFLLPLALILFLEVIGLAWFLTWIADQVQPHHSGGGTFSYHHHPGLYAFNAAFFQAPNLLIFELLLVVYTLIFFISIIGWLLVSLATAAIAKAIHHIYTSHNEDSSNNTSQIPNQTHSIFASLPFSMYRIFIISLCFFVVDILIYFLIALPFSLLSGSKFYQDYHLETLHVWLQNLVFLILNFWFVVSIRVVVLESQYDSWAALQRSAKLLKSKAVTALGLLVVYFVFYLIYNWVVVLAITIPAHSLLLYVVTAALAVGYLAFVVVWSVVVTVFYFVSERKWSIGGGGEEEGEGDHQYQALDVAS